MNPGTVIATVVTAVFVALALWHFAMAALPATGESGAVPSVSGRPLFVPSAMATVAVAVILLGFAGLVAATAGLVQVDVSQKILAMFSYVLAFGLLARAVGEFRYVGLFKRVRGSRFARLDTLIYSPLCLLLAAGVAFVASQHAP